MSPRRRRARVTASGPRLGLSTLVVDVPRLGLRTRPEFVISRGYLGSIMTTRLLIRYNSSQLQHLCFDYLACCSVSLLTDQNLNLVIRHLFGRQRHLSYCKLKPVIRLNSHTPLMSTCGQDIKAELRQLVRFSSEKDLKSLY